MDCIIEKLKYLWKTLQTQNFVFTKTSFPQHHFPANLVTCNNKLFEMHLFLQHVMEHLLMNCFSCMFFCLFVCLVLFCFVHIAFCSQAANSSSFKWSKHNKLLWAWGVYRAKGLQHAKVLKTLKKLSVFCCTLQGHILSCIWKKQSKISELLSEKGMNMPLLLWKTQLSKIQKSK